MTEEQLKTALEHDVARRQGQAEVIRTHVLAAECLRNAAVAARASEAALMLCQPPALSEARQAAQLAIVSLEQALALIGMESTSDE